ncbi:MAG: general secretion pathway protein GspK [Candidatus Hydrogenedentota bacterium]
MLALVFVVLLTAIVVEFSFDAQVDASLAIARDSYFEAYVAAKSAVAEGMALLAADLLDSIGGAQQQVQESTRLVPPGEYDSFFDGVPWAEGAPLKPMNDAMMRTSIDDEYGKINLNALLIMDENGELRENDWLVLALRFFFKERDPELGYDPVDAILDWLDHGDGEEERPDGAEGDYYEGLEIPYPCKNGPMDAVEELLLIQGITPELYYGKPEDIREAEEDEDIPPVLPLSEYLTVHGDWQGKVNPNTAEYETLLAVLTGYAEANPDIANYDPMTAVECLFEPFYQEMPLTDLSEADRCVQVQTTRRNQRTQNRTNNRVNNPPRTDNQQLFNAGEKQARRDGGGDAQPDDGANQAGADPGQNQVFDDAPGAATMFRVNSMAFRIRGDGMMNDTLVRIEAFVWRTPSDPGMIQGGGGTADPFRILDWKVIQ